MPMPEVRTFQAEGKPCKGPVVLRCPGARTAEAKPPRARVGGSQVRERRETQGRRWGLVDHRRVLGPLEGLD